MKVRELLSDESKWTQNAWGRDATGRPVLWAPKTAVCWCLIGAIETCYPRPGEATPIDNKVRDAIGGGLMISKWNDAPERTFAEVKALVERLDV